MVVDMSCSVYMFSQVFAMASVSLHAILYCSVVQKFFEFQYMLLFQAFAFTVRLLESSSFQLLSSGLFYLNFKSDLRFIFLEKSFFCSL